MKLARAWGSRLILPLQSQARPGWERLEVADL